MAFERRVILILLLLVGVRRLGRRERERDPSNARGHKLTRSFSSTFVCSTSQLRVVLYGNFSLVHSASNVANAVDSTDSADQADHAGLGDRDEQVHTVSSGVSKKRGKRASPRNRSDQHPEVSGSEQVNRVNKNVQEPTYIPKKKVPSWNVLNELRLVDSGIRLVLHKRQFIFYNATLRATTLRRYLEYFDGNETTQYVFPAGVFDHLPLEEPNWHFKRCAVVGNSGIVLLKEKGEEIDDHDAVFRLNLAPVKGFERYVGSKTYFNIVNAHNLKEILQGRRRWKSVDQTSKIVMFETASHFARYHLAKPLLEKYGEASPVLLNPMFANHCHDIWIQLLKLLSKAKEKEFNRKPMSGFFATMMAIQVREHVDLYGFDSYT